LAAHRKKVAIVRFRRHNTTMRTGLLALFSIAIAPAWGCGSIRGSRSMPALGGGLASFGASVSTVGPGISNISIRTRSIAGGFQGAHHAALDVGVGFHF
jgi:hypothetical protein